MYHDGGGCGRGGTGLGEKTEASGEHIAMLDELRMKRKAAREREIRDELERWQTAQLVGIADNLYCVRLVLVQCIVHYEGAWASWTGRATVLAKGEGPSQRGGLSHFVGTAADKVGARGKTPTAAPAACHLGQT